MFWTHVGNEDMAIHFQPALHILAWGKGLVLAAPHVAPEQVGLGWARRNSHTAWRWSNKRNGKRQCLLRAMQFYWVMQKEAFTQELVLQVWLREQGCVFQEAMPKLVHY